MNSTMSLSLIASSVFFSTTCAIPGWGVPDSVRSKATQRDERTSCPYAGVAGQESSYGMPPRTILRFVELIREHEQFIHTGEACLVQDAIQHFFRKGTVVLSNFSRSRNATARPRNETWSNTIPHQAPRSDYERRVDAYPAPSAMVTRLNRSRFRRRKRQENKTLHTTKSIHFRHDRSIP